MDKLKKAKIYATVAAICFVIATFFSVKRYLEFSAAYDDYSVSWLWEYYFSVVWWLIYGCFAVLFFIKKKNIVFLIPAGVGFLIEICYLKKWMNIFNVFYPEYFLMAVVYACLFVIFLFNVIPSLSKNAEIITKILCFVPAVLSMVCVIYLNSHGTMAWDYILICIASSVGFLFAGMWLRKTVPVLNKAETVNDNPYSKFDPSSCQSAPSTAGADTLKTYKDLLDSGAITREEFDAKKKEILNL